MIISGLGKPQTTYSEPTCPWLKTIHSALLVHRRGFPLVARQAQITSIKRPHEFYETLIAAIGRAEKRISLAALYLGTEEHERRLTLALGNALRTKPDLTVNLLFDGRRAWRESKASGLSTVTLLTPLLEAYPGRIKLCLYTLPAAQRAASILKSPLDEIAGVFHMKAFVLDDELILSGANLSTEYFVDRQVTHLTRGKNEAILTPFIDSAVCQDRYVHFGRAETISNFYHELIQTLAQTREATSVGGSSTDDGANGRPLRLEDVDNLGDIEAPCLDSPSSQPPDTWVFPTINCAPLGITQDFSVTRLLLDSVPRHGEVRLATAYLNPPEALTKSLASSAPDGNVSVLTAHPVSHGFRSARGLMSLVPKCYAHIEARELGPAFDARDARKEGRPIQPIQMLSYHRPSWTYHAKGLWLREKAGKDPSGPLVTVMGSSNFGRRSYELDLEAQLVTTVYRFHVHCPFIRLFDRLLFVDF